MKISKILTLIIATVTIASCSEEINDLTLQESQGPSKSEKQKSQSAILEISYEITTSTDYVGIPKEISDLDISTLNPGNEKQQVTMYLLENGQLNMTIEEIYFEHKIKIPHKVLPDDTPKTVKTIISGNSVSCYDKNNKLLSTDKIEVQNHIEMVNSIKEIGDKFSEEDINQTIATMQGFKFINNLEEFIKDAPKNDIQVTEQGNGYVTLRMSLSKIDPRMTEQSVLLIDRTKNKLVGSRIYSIDNELLQSTLFGYSNGEVKSLNAIRVKQLITLPSGKEIEMINISKINDLKFNLNI